MDYSVGLLTTTADCDTVLTWAATETANVEHAKSGEQWKQKSYQSSATSIESDLVSVNAQILASQTTIGALPANSDALKAEKTKLTKLDYQLFTLNLRKEKGGSVALLKTQNNVARYDLELAELEALIDAVSARRSSL